MKVAVITVDTEVYKGNKEDLAGKAITEFLEEMEGASVVFTKALPSDKKILSTILQRMSDGEMADLILTTGGAGCAPDDITPEATMEIVEKPVLGIPEAMRAFTLQKTNRAMINRSAAGIRNKSLIVNLPGKEKAVILTLKYLYEVIEHAVTVIQGK
ncbi:MAG: molybdenum cofactor biosynthesis protein B [Suipraeoptans sp.]